MVTNPIAKSVLYASGFAHPGHTEFLGELAAQKFGRNSRPVMMIWSRELAVVPATIHIPLARSPRRCGRTIWWRSGASSRRDSRAISASPRPGSFCRAQSACGRGRRDRPRGHRHRGAGSGPICAEGIAAAGPLPADTLFHAEARENYDAAIGMYHDQALIPVKTLAFDTGVNVTLGLPFIRTSPDHGTAFDIAGNGFGEPTSFRGPPAGRPHGAGAGMSDVLPPLREVVAKNELDARKIARPEFPVRPQSHRPDRPRGRAAEAARPRDRPGPGGLTRALLAHGAKKVIAVERDDRCLAALEEIAAPFRAASRSSRAMRCARLPGFSRAVSGPVRICANLPYNIGTPLLASG